MLPGSRVKTAGPDAGGASGGLQRFVVKETRFDSCRDFNLCGVL